MTAVTTQAVRAGSSSGSVSGVPDGVVYFGGAWVQVPGAAHIEVLNPATEEVLGWVPEAGAGIAEEAMRAARAAFEDWAATPVDVRSDLLAALAQAMEQRGEELARLASAEIGMPIRDARPGQVMLPARVLRSVAELARGWDWQWRDQAGNTVVREPAGVVLGITPWNFPVHQIVAKLAPALAVGCTVVLKPAELAPLNALFLAALCDEVGFPPGVVNVVTGTGAVTGEALVQTRSYDVVSFTGSLLVGRRIGAIAGENIVRATLELGGKSPAVVFRDADLETAVATTVRNCFVNAGQKCNAPTRLLVPEELRERACEIAAEAARSYVTGDPLDDATTLGPLVSGDQRSKVARYVDQARERGARIITGGTFDPAATGFGYPPTIATDVAPDDPIATEEVFGPVLVVLGYRSEEEALELANATEYGLSAEVWSGDERTAARAARRIRAGQVRVNGVRTSGLPVSPFGGYKKSGIGRELGPLGLEEFVEVKAILGDPLLG